MSHELLLTALVVAVVAAWTDWRTGHIPNWLTLGGCAVGVLGQGAVGLSLLDPTGALVGVGHALLGAAASAAVPLLLYRVGGIGGGDVKLLAAMGALCGVASGVEIELVAFVTAALFAGARLAFRAQIWAALRAAVWLVPALLRRRSRNSCCPGSLGEVRFGPSVLCACLLVTCSHWSSVT